MTGITTLRVRGAADVTWERNGLRAAANHVFVNTGGVLTVRRHTTKRGRATNCVIGNNNVVGRGVVFGSQSAVVRGNGNVTNCQFGNGNVMVNDNRGVINGI